MGSGKPTRDFHGSGGDGQISCDSLLVGGTIIAGSLSVYTDKLSSSESLNTLILRLIEQYVSPSCKPSSNAGIINAVLYYYDNTLELPSGVNSTQTSVNNISKWDVSLITNFDNLFSGRSDFNEDISQWNVSSATSMEGMFYDAVSFNYDLCGWDVTSVTNFTNMFTGATAMLNSYPILSTIEGIQEYFAPPYNQQRELISIMRFYITIITH
jgi:surface protein